MRILYLLAEPLAFIIRPIYNYIGNYGLTLIIVTLLIRLITIPLTFASQKSAAKTQMLQPEIAKIQQKYKNDKEKMSTELQKFYTSNNINPMGGCLPLVAQMFVLFGFIDVIYKPLQYILRLSASQIDTIKKAVGAKITDYQVTICGLEGVREKIIELGKEPINFDFLGIDLTRMLKGNLGDYRMWIFPILAVAATFLTSYMSKKQMSSQTNPNESAASMSNTMMMMMPVMTAYFTYIMPAGMSLYWFVSSVVQVIQQYITNKVVKKETEKTLSKKGKNKNEDS